MSYDEDQATIAQWANDTFGPAGSNARVAARANEEMAELLRALTADDNSPKAAEEVADVFIVLYRLAWRLGVDIHEVIDRKMQTNRAREWKLDATGHGYHVREKSLPNVIDLMSDEEKRRFVEANNPTTLGVVTHVPGQVLPIDRPNTARGKDEGNAK
jgi:NTP pyrophosphatase (non-canonical NTP hydrolase)